MLGCLGAIFVFACGNNTSSLPQEQSHAPKHPLKAPTESPKEPTQKPVLSTAVSPLSNVSRTTAAPPPAKAPLLAILPLGEIDDRLLQVAKHAIEDRYGWRVSVLSPTSLPKSAYYKPRKRYRAEKLTDWLEAKLPDGAAKIMGLTEVDISTTKDEYEDWGICGLAMIDGPASVISTFRIQKKLGKGLSKTERKEKFLTRLAELTAHEFGHQLALPHCPNRGCIMEDAKGTVTTFNHSKGALCPTCIAALQKSGYRLKRN